MRYRLKDTVLQEKLDALSDGDFSRNLQMIEPDAFGWRFVLTITREDVERVAEYDPHGWNWWPEVSPSEIGTYRLEVFQDGDHKPDIQVAGYWNGDRWVADDPHGGGLYDVICRGKTRFRPWED